MSKLLSVQVIISPQIWFLSRAYLSLDFARLILKEKSSSFSFGVRVFHILVDREMKSSDGKGGMRVVSFLVDLIYISWSQGRAVGVVAGATRAFGRRTQGVWGAGPPTAGGELSGYQALKPPQINIDLTKSLKCESSFSRN